MKRMCWPMNQQKGRNVKVYSKDEVIRILTGKVSVHKQKQTSKFVFKDDKVFQKIQFKFIV